MKIDILGVQAFVAIADKGSFQNAAGTLHVTQTAITQRLRKLEDFLGVTLVERTTRSIALSQIGRDFLPQARRLLEELGDALLEIRETGKAGRGDVSIACVPTVGVQYLPRIMQEYSARYPNNRIKILDHASSAVADAVLRREAEFGINIAGAHHPELMTTPLLEDQYVLICHADHPLAKRRRVAWKQLQPYPLIFAGQVSGNRALLDTALGANGLRPCFRASIPVTPKMPHLYRSRRVIWPCDRALTISARLSRAAAMSTTGVMRSLKIVRPTLSCGWTCLRSLWRSAATGHGCTRCWRTCSRTQPSTLRPEATSK